MKEDHKLRLQELFEAAHRDPQLKRRLLANPKEVAAEWEVELGQREVERLTKLGAFVELCEEAKIGTLFRVCDPTVCYPSTVWLRKELVELIRDFVIFYPPGPIGYPPPIDYIPEQDFARMIKYPVWKDPIFYPVRMRLRKEILRRGLTGRDLGQARW